MKFASGVSFLFIFICVQHVESYNILAIFPLHSKSHFVMFERLLIELTDRGHEVDVVSHFPQNKPIPRYCNVTKFIITFTYKKNILDITILVFKEHYQS